MSFRQFKIGDKIRIIQPITEGQRTGSIGIIKAIHSYNHYLVDFDDTKNDSWSFNDTISLHNPDLWWELLEEPSPINPTMILQRINVLLKMIRMV